MTKKFMEKDKEKQIAKEHIAELFLEAKKAFNTNPELSDSYVKKAREIQLKFRLRMPAEYKLQFCKECNKYLVPSVNSRVRISEGKIVCQCFSCKKIKRMPFR